SVAGAGRHRRCRPGSRLRGAQPRRAGLRRARLHPIPVAIQALFGAGPTQPLRLRLMLHVKTVGRIRRGGARCAKGASGAALPTVGSPLWLASPYTTTSLAVGASALQAAQE